MYHNGTTNVLGCDYTKINSWFLLSEIYVGRPCQNKMYANKVRNDEGEGNIFKLHLFNYISKLDSNLIYALVSINFHTIRKSLNSHIH